MKDLVEYIVKQIVSHPDKVEVSEQRNSGRVDITLTVDPEDMGLVIGKGGQTIKAIRKLLIIRAMAENIMVNLQLIEPEGTDKNTKPITQEETP